MQKISFKLEVFEGPMDLLLNLITKHKLNIYDIEISSLLEQYLAYLDQCREQDLELAGEFLEMAARLIYIKTASLLPRPEEAQKEKQALQGALIEYALCKQAAALLKERYRGGQVFVREPVKLEVSPVYAGSHAPAVLLETWIAMGQKRFTPEDNSKDRLQRVVSRPVVSVLSKVVYLMRKVYHNAMCTSESCMQMYGSAPRVWRCSWRCWNSPSTAESASARTVPIYTCERIGKRFPRKAVPLPKKRQRNCRMPKIWT